MTTSRLVLDPYQTPYIMVAQKSLSEGKVSQNVIVLMNVRLVPAPTPVMFLSVHMAVDLDSVV